MNLYTKHSHVARVVLGSAAAALAACGGSTTKSTGTTVSAAASARPQLSGVIVFHRDLTADHHTSAIFTIGANGRGQRQVSHPPRSSVDSMNGPPGVMTDGSAFIFDRTDTTNGNASLWRVNADGTDEHRLPSLAGMPGDGWPSVSPDGRNIAVARAWGRPDNYQDLKSGLYVMGSDGSAPRLVADFGYRADVGGATWSPDGRQLVFTVHNNGPGTPSGGTALFTVLANGGSLHRLTNWDTDGQIASPAYSPDGKLVLFRVTPPGQDFGGNLFTVRADGSHMRKLTSFPHASGLGTARWSPDGNWIVFANNGLGGNDDLFVMRADGSHITPLTRTATWESAATWAR